MPNTFLTPPWGEIGCTGCITDPVAATQPLTGSLTASSTHIFDTSARAWFKFANPISTWKICRQRYEQMYWWSVEVASISFATGSSASYNYLYVHPVLVDFDPATLTHATAPTQTQCGPDVSDSAYQQTCGGNDQVWTPNIAGKWRNICTSPLWRADTILDFATSGDVNSVQGAFGTYADDVFVGGHAVIGNFIGEPNAVAETAGEITSYDSATRTYDFNPALESYSATFMNVFPLIYGMCIFPDANGPSSAITLTGFSRPVVRFTGTSS